MENGKENDIHEKDEDELREILQDFGADVIEALIAGIKLFTSGKAVINILE